MIHTCLRAVTESTYLRIPASNESTTATQDASHNKTCTEITMSSVLNYFYFNDTFRNGMELVGKVCTSEVAVLLLAVSSILAPLMFAGA